MADPDDLDPQTDLRIERVVPVPAADLWRGWTDPAVVVRWFTPAPWVTTDAAIDLRPGGVFRTEMRGPDGEKGGGAGCVLEVIPGRRLVWTSALGPGFRPVDAPEEGFHFTASVELEPVGGGTRYTATARHPTPEAARRHAEMGFTEGWGAALDQLVALCADGLD